MLSINVDHEILSLMESFEQDTVLMYFRLMDAYRTGQQSRTIREKLELCDEDSAPPTLTIREDIYPTITPAWQRQLLDLAVKLNIASQKEANSVLARKLPDEEFNKLAIVRDTRRLDMVKAIEGRLPVQRLRDKQMNKPVNATSNKKKPAKNPHMSEAMKKFWKEKKAKS